MRVVLKVLTSQSYIADMSKIVQQSVEVCPKPGAGLKAFLGEITCCCFFFKLTFSIMLEKSGNYLLHVIFQGNVFQRAAPWQYPDISLHLVRGI